jgi:hypothetical protein
MKHMVYRFGDDKSFINNIHASSSRANLMNKHMRNFSYITSSFYYIIRILKRDLRHRYIILK